MKNKFLISVLVLLLITLLSAGCAVDEDNVNNNSDAFDGAAGESVDTARAVVDVCASRTQKIENATFVLLGGATLTEVALGENGIQAFILTMGDADCSAYTSSGLLVQSSKGVNNMSFSLNGIQISLGSTVFLTAPQADNLLVQTLEGSARVIVEEKITTSIAGTQVTVPLDDTLQASGAPAEVQSSVILEDEGLPLDLLEYEIEYTEPLGVEELALYNEYEVLFDGIDVEDADELFGYLTEQEGEDIPEYLISALGYTGFGDDVEEYLQADLGYDLEEYDNYTGEELDEESDADFEGEDDGVDTEDGEDDADY